MRLARGRHDNFQRCGTVAKATAARGDELEAQILAAELRVIERDERVQRALRSWGQRAARATAPRRLLLPGLGVLAAAGLGLLGWRRWHRPGLAAAQAQGAGFDGPGRGAPPGSLGAAGEWLLHLLPMAWPLLPAGWRARVSPAAATALLGVALPLLGRLLRPAGRASAPPLPTVRFVDLGRYGGLWHEIARLPTPVEAACRGPARAHYALEGGLLHVTNACPAAGGERVAHGVGRVLPGTGNARLEVNFLPPWLRWLPIGWAPYWILHVDETAPDYRVALVGTPDRRALWLLARDARLPADERAALVSRAADLGFDVARLTLTQPA